ncbi:MAG: MFS transporter [Verrucomicrobiota bacterium]|jgi:MFS family permease|nr:MFS transporter [Verrucomicrobiota bacterium]
MSSNTDNENTKWYHGISRYQWLVLLIASLGWVFDIFEGQIFVASMRDAMPQLLGVDSADHPEVGIWSNYSFASFLLGGAFGGVLFGVMSDRIGRSRTLIFTILFYSIFTSLTALATEAWHMVILRFLVAMGVGGEWAVASAMVAEVMPQRSRSVMSSIFHASSVFGTLLAAAVGYFILSAKPWGDSTWKLGFLIGLLPALLTLWIRWKLHEPEKWKNAQQIAKKDGSQATGRLSEIFRPEYIRGTIIGVTLATIGLVTFWGCHIYGKNALMRKAQVRALAIENISLVAPEKKGAESDEDYKKLRENWKTSRQSALEKHSKNIKQAEMLSMTLNTIGGGLGLVLFGAISNRLGRRGAFVLYHAGAFIMALVMFKVLIPQGASETTLAVALPIFGFLTLGMHAGYAVYFPELYPTRLRGSGTGFCFNMGRIGSALYLFIVAKIGWQPDQAALYMAPVFAVGIAIAWVAPETRDQELPE